MAIREKHNQSKSELCFPGYKTIPAGNGRELQQRWLNELKSQFGVRLCLLVKIEATPVKSHSHDCLNMRWTRMTTIDMARQMGKENEATTLHERLQETKERCMQEKWSSSGKSTPIGSPAPDCQS